MKANGYIRGEPSDDRVSQFIGALYKSNKYSWFVMGIENYIKEVMTTSSAPLKMLAYIKWLVAQREMGSPGQFTVYIDDDFIEDFNNFVTSWTKTKTEFKKETIKKCITFLVYHSFILRHKNKDGKVIRGKYDLNPEHCYISNEVKKIFKDK